MEKDYWKEFYDEAKGYHKAVKSAVEKGKYNPETNYNIITMSVEKYLVAVLFYVDIPATNHTLSGLVAEVKFQGHHFSDELESEISFIDSFQYICSIEGFEMREPSQSDVERMTKALNQLGSWAEKFVQKDLVVN